MSLYVDIRKKVKDFSLDVKFESSKERHGLLGASGCGKSMTLKCIAGIERPDEGRIILNDRVVFDSKEGINISPQKRKIGYLFQNYALFPHMSVEENIACGIKATLQDKKIKVKQMIELVHLQGLEKRYPMQLSGGQQQRVALARILAYEPDVLLLDEPLSALDTYYKEKLLQELLDVLDDYGGDTIIVSHSRDEIYSLCGNISIIDNGEVALTGKTTDIFSKPTKLIAARLTGCKNISRAKKLSEYEVKALDWGIVLKTTEIVSDSTHYVGIRAHDIRTARNINEVNALRCEVAHVVEGPFENSLILSNGSYTELWWKVSKAFWVDTLKERVQQYISLPSASIMLLE